MPEKVPAAKAKSDLHKAPVRVPSPDTQITPAQPEIETVIPEVGRTTPNLSPRQLLHLQRTVGNKAVANMLRSQKPAAPAGIQRDIGITSPYQSGPLAADSEKGSVPDSDIKATDAQMANPVLALKTYREAVGVHLREGKRHKFKIERYKAFIEADFVHIKSQVPGVIAEDAALKEQMAIPKQPPAKLKALNKQRKTLDEKMKKLGGSNPMEAESQAEARVQTAYNASIVAESELPLIEYAYDTLVKMRHDDREGSKHGTFFGSGNPYERVKYYEKKLEHAEMMVNAVPSAGVSEKAKKANAKDAIEFRAHIVKQKDRIAAIEQAKKDMIQAQTLRGQAKLSEDMMAVKRKQLKVEKLNIKKFERNVQIGSHIWNKAVTGVITGVVSTVTLGTQEYEASKAEGGYSSKRQRVSMLDTWRRDWAALKSVWTTRPYGKMTALHLFFQGLGNLILKPLRKVFTAAALIFTGLSLIPPLAPITGPLAAFCTLVTLGLVAAKMALDAVLATWSSLTLALNKNAHNTDVLRGQAVGQVADVAAGAVAVGSAFGVPAIGNAVGGSYVNPLQNLNKQGGSIMNYDPGKAGGSGSFGEQLGHQAQVQSAKGGGTLGLIISEKLVGALAELEELGPGAKALFKARQEQILARKLTGPDLNLEIEKAKQAALEYEVGRLNRSVAELNLPSQNNPSRLAQVQEKLVTVKAQLVLANGKVAAAASGAPKATPTATASTPTTAKKIDGHPHETVALPAQGQFAARMNPEAEKEAKMREASKGALAAKAKAQVQSLVSGVGQSQSQGSEVASGAQAASSGVAAVGSSQGAQPVDAPNASDAQEQTSAAQDILQQVLEVAQAAPAAVDEAIIPAPVSS